MCLHPHAHHSVPDETSRVARAVFPRGHLYLRLRDELGPVFSDEAFAPLFSTRGQPAETPWRLALVSLLQYAENLSDRQAADAVRSRIDWKYLLGLELTDTGFDSSVLSEFRTRLVAGTAEHILLDTLLTLCRERKLLTAGGRQRTDSTHVLAAVRALNRLECVGEAMRHALNSLAVAAPAWLRVHNQPHWVDRYGPRAADDRLPQKTAQRQKAAEEIGIDGHALLDRIYAPHSPSWLQELPGIDVLRRVWLQQFYVESNQIHWRTEKEGIPPSRLFLSSPYDQEAHYARKRTTSWVGYKVHLTETCDEAKPHLIIHVETRSAPVADAEVTEPVHRALQNKGLLPQQHLVDTGYLDAPLLVSTQRDFGVDLVGPTRADYHWQAREKTGYAVQHFRINWEQHQAVCPQGKTSAGWSPTVDCQGNEVVNIKFSRKDCGSCSQRSHCTRGSRPRRCITVRPQAQYLALEQARARQATAEYAALEATRAGMEGTLSQGVRRCGLRRSRYIGLAKTHLQHVITAAALNLVRVGAWLCGQPRAVTRRAAYAQLINAA